MFCAGDEDIITQTKYTLQSGLCGDILLDRTRKTKYDKHNKDIPNKIQ